MSTLPAFGLTLRLVPNVKLDAGLVVCAMTVGVRIIDKVPGKCNTQKHNVPLIRVLTICAKHNFVFVLTIDLEGDDGSPGPFRAQHA